MKFLLFTILFLATNVFAADGLERNLYLVPTHGEAQHANLAWAAWSWPFAEGGLDSQINDLLSPHQKIERITNGAVRFQPLAEWQRRNELWWYGYCDTMVIASANYPCEPTAVDFSMLDGSKVHFNREEVKGVLAEYIKQKKLETKSFGTRLQSITPGLFHMVLGNLIGVKRNFVGMVYGGAGKNEIHNHKIFRYESRVLAFDGNKNLRKVVTKVYYSPELSSSTGDSSTQGVSEVLEVSYSLKVNENGIVDEKSGKWLSEDHPTILWEIPTYRLEEDQNVPAEVRELVTRATQRCGDH